MCASPSEHLAICAIAPSSTPHHTHRALAVPISPTFSVPIYSHPSLFSDSTYPGSLHRILLKLSNTHHPNPCVGGPRCGRRGNGPCCPCVDHPRCEHGPPSVRAKQSKLPRCQSNAAALPRTKNVTENVLSLVRRGDDGVFREKHIAARH